MLFMQREDVGSAYSRYCSHHDKAVVLIRELMKNPEFSSLVVSACNTTLHTMARNVHVDGDGMVMLVVMVMMVMVVMVVMMVMVMVSDGLLCSSNVVLSGLQSS